MKLTIDHLAKIAHAELDFNGITIIAGENNTGKSTAGKVLYTVFSALSNLSERVSGMRVRKIENIVSGLSFIDENLIFFDFEDDIVDLVRERISLKSFSERLHRVVKIEVSQENELASVLESVEQILAIPQHTIEEEVIEQRFSSVFLKQYIPLLDLPKTTHVNLCVKNKTIDLQFTDKGLTYLSEIQLKNNAHVIDDPALLDSAVRIQRRMPYSIDRTETQKGLLREILQALKNVNDNPDHGVIDVIINSQQIKTVMDSMMSVVDGEMRRDDTGTYKFFTGNLQKPIDASNLSMGLKAFVLLQFLIQNRVLNPKDVLILDEPEIHLHPEWQLKYAELVVLLQKYFDLTILITSHSPNFIDAIQLYSKKHGISDKVNAYRSVLNDDETVTMDAVKPDDWDELFAHFLPPMDELQTMREQYGV